MNSCQKCGRPFNAEWVGEDDDEMYLQDKLCPDCFEGAIEDFEDKRRERIARENEY